MVIIRVIAGGAFLITFGCIFWVAMKQDLYPEAFYVLLIICMVVILMLMRKIRYDILSSLAQSQHVPIHAMYTMNIPMPSSASDATAATIASGVGPVPMAPSIPGVVAVTFPVTQDV